MWTDLLLQAVIILVTLFMFLLMHDAPRKALKGLRFRNRAGVQAKSHFIRGAQLLAQARSATSRSSSSSLAEDAVAEADKAVSLDPRDAAAHILKALALDLLGFKTSAIDSFDSALSPMCAKSLSGKERGDAMIKRGELRMGASSRKGGQVDESIVEDLSQGSRLSGNAKGYCLLGKFYEGKKMTEDAKKAFEEALKIDSDDKEAKEGLDRLAQSSKVVSAQMIQAASGEALTRVEMFSPVAACLLPKRKD